MKCVTTEDGLDILREIHKGVCANTPRQSHWSAKHTEPVSGGLPPCPTPKIWCEDVRTASSSVSKLMSRPTPSLLYLLPGHSLAGAST
jgi:hypothetical protein